MSFFGEWMNATTIIVFREVLEIALIVGVLMAATKGLPKRGLLILAGLLLGVAGSGLLALSTDQISMMMEGVGQEVFNAGIMFTAVLLLCWTALWMRRHGRELARHLKQVGEAVTSGERPLFALVLIVALSTLREGAEIVLFVQGQLLIGKSSLMQILGGASLGAVLGFIAGAALYVGLLKAAQKHLLSITGWLLILLAAGMAAQGMAFLLQADLVPALVDELWGSSWLIADGGTLAAILQVLVGYTPRPTGIELAAYLSVLLVTGLLYWRMGMRTPVVQKAATPSNQPVAA